MRIFNLITICLAFNTFGQTYTYDLAGRMTCAVYTNGAQANVGYDHAGNVSNVSSVVVLAAQPPILLIQNISSNTITGGAAFVLNGIARASAPLDWVFIESSSRLDQLATTTNGWTNWSATLDLPYGTNYVTILCQDVAGDLASTSRTLVVSPPSFVALPISFAQSGTGWTMKQTGSFSSVEFTNGLLTLTDNGQSETRSFFYNTPQYVGAFYSSFTYQAGGNLTGDGVAFVLQSDPRGQTAIGGAAGGLGVAGISPSVELELNISGAPQNIGFAVMTNGLTCSGGANGNYIPTIPQSSYEQNGVSFNSGDLIDVIVNYFGNGYLSVSFADESDFGIYTTNVYIGDIATILGSDFGYIGFTGTTGGRTAIQTVTKFAFISVPPPALSVQSVTVHFAGTVGVVQGSGVGFVGMPVSGSFLVCPSELVLVGWNSAFNYSWYSSTNIVDVVTNGIHQTFKGFYMQSLDYQDAGSNTVDYVQFLWGTNFEDAVLVAFPTSSIPDFSLYGGMQGIQLGLSSAFSLADYSEFWVGYDAAGTNGVYGDENAFFGNSPGLNIRPFSQRQFAISCLRTTRWVLYCREVQHLSQMQHGSALTNVPTVNSTSYEVQFPLPSASLATNQFFRLNFTN